MIHGVGIDLVKIDRIENNISRFGKKFAERVLSAGEINEYENENQPARFIAKRFAAKEAVTKALGTGFRNGISLKQISIVHSGSGQPCLQFVGKIAELIKSKGIQTSHLSLSDEADYVCACVVLEK